MSPKSTIFVGLDVDSKFFHATLVSREEGEIASFRVPAEVAALVKKLKTYQKSGREIHACYEAGFHGFSIQRDLTRAGFHCDVIAPSNIPRHPGQRVKTDRIDAKKIAEFYMNGLLTVVAVPEEIVESDRDLIRTRAFLQKQNTKTKQAIHCRVLPETRSELQGVHGLETVLYRRTSQVGERQISHSGNPLAKIHVHTAFETVPTNDRSDRRLRRGVSEPLRRGPLQKESSSPGLLPGNQPSVCTPADHRNR